ncbi:MAG: biotin transporter BioY [Ilumatobacteraceae bacterium]
MSTVTPLTLADTLPAIRSRTAVLVLAGALVTAAAAQVQIPLGFTPVPISGQTFAVLLVASTLGARRAVASQSLYWLLGAIGLPFYAGGQSGWTAATGSTFGYFVGFVVAAALVGSLAERGHDRTLLGSAAAMGIGTIAIYVFGITWLARDLDVPLFSGDGHDAFSYGLAPFLIGDLVKLILAAVSTPAAWRMIERRFGN